jgi:hypothetical protein
MLIVSTEQSRRHARLEGDGAPARGVDILAVAQRGLHG